MDIIIVLITSIIGAFFYDLDLCTLYTFISIANELCNYTNERTAKRGR